MVSRRGSIGRGEWPRCVQGLEAGGQVASGMATGMGEGAPSITGGGWGGGQHSDGFLPVSHTCPKLGSHCTFFGSMAPS